MPEIKFIVFAGIAIGIVINIIRKEGFFVRKNDDGVK